MQFVSDSCVKGKLVMRDRGAAYHLMRTFVELTRLRAFVLACFTPRIGIRIAPVARVRRSTIAPCGSLVGTRREERGAVFGHAAGPGSVQVHVR